LVLRRVAGFAVMLVAGSSCLRNPAGSRCEVVCRAEAQCAERLELTDVSYTQCVQGCSELEHDDVTAKLVAEHARCVLEAPSCAQAMECP
jgi:hypothetical protein